MVDSSSKTLSKRREPDGRRRVQSFWNQTTPRPVGVLEVLLMRRAAAILVIPFLGLLCLGGASKPPAPAESGESAFVRKDFKKALGLYRAELKVAPDVLKERRVVACLAALGEWDEALREGESVVGRQGESLDGVRARRLLADVYGQATHTGFKLGAEIRRGDEQREGERVWLQEEDSAAARKHLEAAREILYRMEDGQLPRGGENDEVVAEIVATDLELAELLHSRWGFGPMPDPLSTTVHDRYFAPRKEWAAFLRAEDLYREVIARGGSDTRSAALATYASALLRYRARTEVERLKQADRPLSADEKQALASIGDPVGELRDLGRRYPGDPLGDEAALAAARMLEERGEPRAAEAAYEELIARYPGSLWVSDARAALQDLRRKDVSFETSGPVLPGRPAALSVSSRNLARLVFTAERLDPESVFLNPEKAAAAGASFRDAPPAPTLTPTASPGFRWEHATGDDGSHRPHSAQLPLPPLPRGLYRVEARGEGVAFAAHVLVSDLVLVQKTGSEQLLVYVADVASGAAVPGVRVVVREREAWRSNGKVEVRRGLTGPDGTLTFVSSRELQNRSVESLALLGDRVAATPEAYAYRSGEGEPARVHLSTDRPVYRPGSTVQFRGQALRTAEGGETTLAQARATVIIRDPRGNELYRHQHVTDAFGVFSGSVAVGEAPPLGEYPIEVQIAGEGRVEVAGDRFRVEEYRKPDYEVRVEAAAAIRSGDPGAATILARYYFGSPVADAAVTWRVFWSSGLGYWPFQDPNAWLFGEMIAPRWRRPERTLVAEGAARTDVAGRASVDFPTRAGEDGRYEIEAQVVDLSRREVRGGGTLRASRAAFALYVRPDRGFYRPGETATFEIAASDPNGQPAPARPSAVVYRRRWSALRESVTETPVFEQAVAIDASGTGELKWRPEEGGEYRLALRALDDRQEAVTAETQLDVAEEGTSSDLFRLSDVEMTVERTSYREGETARVLLSSSRRGTLLFTEEAGGRIFAHRAVALDGHRRVVDVRLTRAHAPNVFLRATLVSDGQVFAVQREVLVPPTPRFLTVEAKPRSLTVKPGAQGVIDLQVRDEQGKPVAASLLVVVTDRSVEAIQAPYAPDIRAFFYGGRRGLSVQETSSFAFRPAGAIWRKLAEVRYRRHGQLPGWWGSLRRQRTDWAGNEFEVDAFGEGVAEQLPAAAIEGGVAGGLFRTIAPSAPAAKAVLADSVDKKEARQEPGGLAEATTRSVFADTAFWNAAVTTGPDGTASVTVPFPDSLTDWKVVARGGDARARVGEATTGIVARKDLMVRLQSPRFFVERDRAVLSALIQNDTAQALEAVARIEVSDVLKLETPGEAKVHVDKNGQARVEWPVRVVGSGTAKIRVAALTSVESDAAEMSFEALVHGTDKQVSQAGRLRAGESRELLFDVPAERGAGTARLSLNVAPTLLSSLLEAVPYLVDYPYGCVEQTMSRFLPSVVLARTLHESGVRLEDLAARRRLQMKGRLGVKDKDPVFRAGDLDAMVRAGLGRLYGFQGGDGGWGWWKDDASDLRITAYVVYGLATARAAGYAVDAGAFGRGVSFLEAHAADITSLHARAYAAFALASAGRTPAGLDKLLARRGDLTVHGKALLALALQRSNRSADARTLVSNLEDLARVDEASDTASWRVETQWWFWENDRVETQAMALWALAEIAPQHALAPKVARWLLLNRQGSRWYSTRDTAHAIYALAAFAKGAGETSPDLTVEARSGEITKTFRITPANAYAFDDTLVLGDAELGAGRRTLSLRVTGTGALYYNAVLRYFTKQEDIRGAGTDLRLTREYFHRVPRVVEVGGARTLEYDLVAIPSLASVRSGDEVEVKLSVEAPTAYDHLVFEDPKPAGFEPIALVSGSRYGDGLCSNMELRDERVAFFVTHLAQGRQVIRYVLRAETPGAYHALPAHGYAMYAPEIAALADEWRTSVEP